MPIEFGETEEEKNAPLKSKKEKPNKAEKVDEGDAKPIQELPQEFLKMIKDLQEQVEELKKVHASEESDEDIRAQDDYLNPPAVFFAFATKYSIHSEKRYNRESLPPLGEPIKFEKLYRYKNRATNGKGLEVISISQAVVNSKVTAKWLREHSLFGIKFFEQLVSAQNVNVTFAEKMAEMSSVVSSMNDYAIIERCRREGIPIQNDLVFMRKALTKKLAEDALAKQRETQKIKLGSMEKDEKGRLTVIEYRNLAQTETDPSERY